MINMELPVTKFINSIICGLLAGDDNECLRNEGVYADAFKLGFDNKGNDNFIKDLLYFWMDYVKYMQTVDVVVCECDLESCEMCSTEDIDDDDCDEACDCHFDDEPDQDTNDDDEVD